MIGRAIDWVQLVLIPWLGLPGMFLAAFMDSSFLSLPEINDFMMITSCSGYPWRAPLFISATTLGSITGCCALWYVGRRGGEALLVRRYGPEAVARARAAYAKYDMLALAIPAIMPPPMPFKIFVLSAGVFGFPFTRFVLTIAIARGLRYTFWGTMGILYGERAKLFLQGAEPYVAAALPWLAAAAVIGVIVTLVVRRRKAAVPEAAEPPVL